MRACDALSAHARDELGLSDAMSANPTQAALASAASFAVGAMLPLAVTALALASLLIWWVSGTALAFLATLGATANWDSMLFFIPVLPGVNHMFLISIDDWMKATHSRIYSRSDALKALDKAIADAGTINQEVDQSQYIFMSRTSRLSESDKNSIDIGEKKRAIALEAVRKAFDKWVATQTSKGQNWRDSGRNEKGAVAKLFEQLKYFGSKNLSESDEAAIAAIVESRNKSIPLLFNGCTCVLKADRDRVEALKDKLRKAKVVKGMGQIAKKSYTLASSPSTTASSSGSAGSSEVLSKVNAMIPDIVSNAFGTTLDQLSWEAGETFFKETLAEALSAIKEEILAIMPAAGAVVASGTLVVNTIKLIQSGLAASTLLDLTKKLEEGDSKAALARIRDWQLHDIALRTSKVARAGANTAAQLVAIFTAGAGTAPQLILGICNAIVALLEMVAEMGMQYKESRALTKYLSSTAASKLGKDIFTASPLAAAYYLLNTPTSDIALQLVNIGDPGWMQEVEQIKLSGPLATVITESERLIDASRYVLMAKGKMRFREREGKELLVKAKEFVGMEPLRSKTVMEGESGNYQLRRSTGRVDASSRD